MSLDRANHAYVNRQALQITAASYALVAAVAIGVSSADEFLRGVVLYPALSALAGGVLGYIREKRDSHELPSSQLFAGRVLNAIWLFLPLVLAVYAAFVMMVSGTRNDVAWIPPVLALLLGQQFGQYLVDRTVDGRQIRDDDGDAM